MATPPGLSRSTEERGYQNSYLKKSPVYVQRYATIMEHYKWVGKYTTAKETNFNVMSLIVHTPPGDPADIVLKEQYSVCLVLQTQHRANLGHDTSPRLPFTKTVWIYERAHCRV